MARRQPSGNTPPVSGVQLPSPAGQRQVRDELAQQADRQLFLSPQYTIQEITA